MKRLPISYQSFPKLREDNCVYIDKTRQIHRLLTEGRQYFFSRPRRFGKSLTLSTIKAIYEGRKELFEGLWIENNWDWSQTKPVIQIPFSSLIYNEIGIPLALLQHLKEVAKAYKIEIETDNYVLFFDILIKRLREKLGRVVILIDEYDKPIIDYLEPHEWEQAKINRDNLRNFYRYIKDNDDNIEFFFMTGVSRFSHTGIFSHLNHLRDITIDDDFADLVGYTQKELLQAFPDFLKRTQKLLKISKKELLLDIKQWYNGYSWNGQTSVYNPFSIISFFAKNYFQDYWFQSGSPKFLIDLIKEKGVFNFKDLRVNEALVHSYEIENLNLRTLLFQTGYLTIKNFDRRNGILTLDYPNREVEQAMGNNLISLLTDIDITETKNPVLELKKAFLENNVEKIIKIINTLLKDVPSHLIHGKDERFYHTLVHLYFRYLGWFVESEVHTSDGRMDALVKTQSHIYILEFKIDKTAEFAINQIKEKQYPEKYSLENKQIVIVGINFNTKKRTINDWAMESC